MYHLYVIFRPPFSIFVAKFVRIFKFINMFFLWCYKILVQSLNAVVIVGQVLQIEFLFGFLCDCVFIAIEVNRYPNEQFN